MTDRLTDEELDGLETLAKVATPGPWEAETHGCITAMVGQRRRQVASVVGDAAEHGRQDIDVKVIRDANTALVVAAVGALPRLLAEVRESRRRAAKMAERCDQCGAYRESWQDLESDFCPLHAYPFGSCDGLLRPQSTEKTP